ncbi:cytochrome b/b6 domain-containing protein [Thauera mechernichensis]|uniref:Cytochrome b/b6 domain-containing protein n=1 Tax=Thauera mechernichensis TaxID=82788 RepID=A0ABW3WAR9_9RHOO|nr:MULTISPECIES: cytochrome b/b6 domain-containing protein [Thauera]MDG3064303.1 cytochrome b/b6 domain-containing protein [Thauera mechernichensis]HNS92641.1 cytochrome b/b6 domain-containing protein [Thauera sp.]
MSERIYLFTRFERFWHWMQAALIITLLVTGFAIHGSHGLLDFRTAVEVHELAAWLLIGLWVLAIFWHFTTGQWKHYVPTLSNIDRMVKYYAYGIFIGAPHPYKVTVERKHNPLQRIAYLGVKLLINPLVWVSGLVYLFWGRLQPLMPDGLGLQQVAQLHTLGAFLMLAFLIIHVYLATAGHTPLAHIKAMITGWEDVHDEGGATAKPAAPARH